MVWQPVSGKEVRWAQWSAGVGQGADHWLRARKGKNPKKVNSRLPAQLTTEQGVWGNAKELSGLVEWTFTRREETHVTHQGDGTHDSVFLIHAL